MTIDFNSTIDDLLKQDLPRTNILADIHKRVIEAVSSLKAPDSVNLLNVGVLKELDISQIESFYSYWLELAQANDFMQSKSFPLEVTFAYGLLLPYYVDYTSIDFDKHGYITPANDDYRSIQLIDDDSFPHAYAVHHAHQVVTLFIKKIDRVNSPAFQGGLKKGGKTRENRRFFRGAFQKSLVDYPDISQKERIDVVMDELDSWSENNHPISNMMGEYDRDIIKKWISEHFNEKPHDITWFEIPSSQNEIIHYIQDMPKLKLPH